MILDIPNVIVLAQQLIAQPSITPDDAGCQAIIAQLLRDAGCEVVTMPQHNVMNLWVRYGTAAPLFVFAGHTDVVPCGDLSCWEAPPFTPTIRDGYLYGRGAADMKGSLAAMVVALMKFIRQVPQFSGSIGLLITSAEEGDFFQHGTPYVMQQLIQQGIKPDYCVVGEPSSNLVLGDTIRVGRRGSLSGELKVIGKQGHVAYPQHAINPIHVAAAALVELCNYCWDAGNQFFPPTTFQLSNISAGTGATNVIPGELLAAFNFRYSTATDAITLQRIVATILQRHQLNYDLSWRLNGEPFLTSGGKLITVVQQALATVTGKTAELSTAGGTSDGRFIAPYGIEVVELGPLNSTIHQVNECVQVADLLQLEIIYREILTRIFN